MNTNSMVALLADRPVPVKQNVVSTVNLDCKLDLKLIALQARNAEYNPRRFGAIIMRIKDPHTTALIFSSGKMVVTGAKSEGLSKLAARRFTKIVEKLGFPVKFNDFKIHNIVASCDVGFPIGLEALNYSQGKYAKYEPEIFPGLVYQVMEPKVSMLVFASGKVVITGAKNYNNGTLIAWEKVYPIITQHVSSKKELIRGLQNGDQILLDQCL